MLGLDLQLCASPRMLDQGDAVSLPFQATRSIVHALRAVRHQPGHGAPDGHASWTLGAFVDRRSFAVGSGIWCS
eukprot:4407217-Pyramimonas_sp.AAC.1